MDEADRSIRNATYGALIRLGRAPTSIEVAAEVAGGLPAEEGDDGFLAPAEVEAAWRRLHDEHALVLDADGRLRMLNPFSAVPTDFRVRAAGRSWFANCAWDAFGIGASLGVDSEFATTCADCGAELQVRIRDRRPDDEALVWHVLVPAAQWWQDIGFT